MFIEINDESGGRAAAQAYWNAVRKLRQIWRDLFYEELPSNTPSAKGTYDLVLAHIKEKISSEKNRYGQIYKELDIDEGDFIEGVMINSADFDDLSPNLIKSEIVKECSRRGNGKFPLRDVLRGVFDKLFSDKSLRRPNVGANRHWPRVLQYLRELEAETDNSPDGQGIRLRNSCGHGRVAANPRDPGKLDIAIDTNYISRL